ncbi:MAG: hypothetical protein ACRDQU_13600 [Pseudonocardiaceae bacterium]
MRKRNFLLVAGVCLATLSLAVGSALADPSGTPTFRDLAGTGSDTTQGVMNSLSNDILIGGTKQIGSYDAATTPGQTISTKSTAACTNIPRPSGSDAGIQALAADRVAGTHCLAFARSSTDNHTAHVGDHLTYVPFATDSVAYATLDTSAIPRNLTVSQLQQVYNCTVTSGFTPLLPQFNSGTRKFFLRNILGFTDSADYTTLHPCVSDKDPTNPANPLLENTGNKLTSTTQIEPYAASSWIAQTSKNVTDVHGKTLLGNIGGINTLTLNSSAAGTRPVFNVLPNVLAANGPNSKAVFVGPGSSVCTDTATITKLGFATRSDCGSTLIQSDTSNGADTVGAGE